MTSQCQPSFYFELALTTYNENALSKHPSLFLISPNSASCVNALISASTEV